MFKLEKKADLPESPGYNFIERILGSRGLSIRQPELETECTIFIRGKSSIKMSLLLDKAESTTNLLSSRTRLSSHSQSCTHRENAISIYNELRQQGFQDHKCSYDACTDKATWICLSDDCKAPLCGKMAQAHHSKHQMENGHYIQMTTKGRVWCGKCNHEIKMDAPEEEDVDKDQERPLVLFSKKRIDSVDSEASASSFQLYKRTPNSALSNRMNYVLIEEEDPEDFCRPRGAVGLRNLGNTCYMNAAIQSLSNCPPLREYFRQCYSPASDLVLGNANQSKTHHPKPLSSSFKELVTKLWTKDQTNSISPTSFVYRIRENCAQFRGWSQQDSQEFIRCFLDLLHSELKRPIHPREEGFRKRINSPSTNSEPVVSASSSRSSSSNGDIGENDHFETADSGLNKDDENKKKKQVRFRSIISDIFDGELISTVKCLTCQHLSHTRETFQDISLSIPTVEQLELMRESMSDLELSGENAEETIRQYKLSDPEGYTQWFVNIAYRIFVGPIMSTFSYFYRYFFTGAISLEDCLKAFFTADHLRGDDMYSCDKCTKLRNGMKQCKLTRLPEILTIHLKRFRHDQMYNSKIGTRVTFPLCDLNIRSFMDRKLQEDIDISAEYDLVALISHRGSGLDYGHYIAYCRNDLDKCWYEYDDSFVSKVCNEEVMSREAYVLFYQKKTTTRMENAKDIVKAMLRRPEPRLKDNDRFFVSREWIQKFFSFSEPGSISNFDFLCPHGQLASLFVPEVEKHVVTVSAKVWDFLHTACGGGPTLQMLAECHACRQALIEARKRKQHERRMFDAFQKQNRYSTVPPNCINKAWFERWEEYVSDIEKDPPPAISNEALIITNADGSTRLRTSSNFRTIGYEAYHFLCSVYGGGPEIFCLPFANQPTAEQVREMLDEVEETERLQRLKQSHPIVSEPQDEDDGVSTIKKIKINESIEAEV